MPEVERFRHDGRPVYPFGCDEVLVDDPFDRILIGQTRVEGLRVASRDRAFRDYDVEVVDPLS